MDRAKTAAQAADGRARTRRPGVWRRDDLGVVTDGRVVLRVGYPRTVDDYLRELRADERFRSACDLVEALATGACLPEPDDLLARSRRCRSHDRPYADCPPGTYLNPYGERSHPRERIEREAAYMRAHWDRFGGPERSIHWRPGVDVSGRLVRVLRVRTAKTGTYSRGSGETRCEWSGEYDFDPNALVGVVTHRIAVVAPVHNRPEDYDAPERRQSPPWEVPVAHLRRPTDEEAWS